MTFRGSCKTTADGEAAVPPIPKNRRLSANREGPRPRGPFVTGGFAVASILALVLIRYAVAGNHVDFVERLQGVVPPGWQVGRQAGTSVVNVTRKSIIPPSDLTVEPIPCGPEYYAETNGIQVWFYIEPVGSCSDSEYLRRKSQNSKVWAQLEPLRKKIEQIPPTPRVKPSFLSRTPRNEEEQSWLTEHTLLWKQLEVLPTHHFDSEAFCITLLKSYAGAKINTAEVREEIDGVRQIIETVLVPYESQGNPQQTNNIGTTSAQQEGKLRVHELDNVIKSIHADLLQLQTAHSWLSGYTNSCFWGNAIFFMPKLKDEGDRTQPQQPDQLYIGYVPFDQNKGFKYHNDVDGVTACQFPSLQVKLYANILIRGKDNSKCVDEIRKCIITQCEALHKEMNE